MKKSIAERFWSKVDFSGECWEWKAFRNHDGYGLFFVNRNVSMSGMIVASRFAWELFNGPIPDGLCALHNCDNPPCVNPSHLFLGTREKNNEDMVLKDRQSKGEHRPQHKLTLDQVLQKHWM